MVQLGRGRRPVAGEGGEEFLDGGPAEPRARGGTGLRATSRRATAAGTLGVAGLALHISPDDERWTMIDNASAGTGSGIFQAVLSPANRRRPAASCLWSWRCVALGVGIGLPRGGTAVSELSA